MKIAFIYDAIYPWVKGGAERRIYEVGKRLASSGHEVHLYGIQWWDGNNVLRYKGMILHGVCGPQNLYVNGRRSISEAVLFSIKLFSHLLKEKFDIIDVCAFPYFSCISAKITSIVNRTPMVITWHEVWGDYWHEYLGRWGFFGKKIEYIVSKLGLYHIAVSDMTKKNLENLNIKSGHIRVVPNGIDLERISNIIPYNKKCDILFVGRLIKEKNVNTILEVISRIKGMNPDIKCNIIGEGPEKEQLIQNASAFRINTNVEFFGFMEYDEIIARIKSSKILILPSAREGFGMVVIEAFACGVPVVTVNKPLNAASKLVNEKTGVVVNLDVEELTSAVHTLIIEDKIRKKMSENALNAAKMYEWDKIVVQLTHLYEGLTL